jgi:uncharacterized membrane protein
MAEEIKTAEKEINGEEKIWALLGYLWFLCVLPLLLKRDSKFVQHHAKQGLIIALIFCFVWIPFFGWILGIILFAVWVIAVIKALTGQYWNIPLIGEIVKRIKL